MNGRVHPAPCLLLAAMVLWPLAAPAGEELPDPRGFVNDYAGVLTAEERGQLDAITGTLEQASSIEMGIAIVDSVAPRDSKGYAVDLFAKWGIGKKGKDNGVLILLAMQERRVEIEVGYGLEPVLTDSRAGRLLDTYAVPQFRQGRMGAGLVALAEAVARVVTGAEDAELLKAAQAAAAQAALEQEKPAERNWEIALILMLTVGVPILLVVAMFTMRPWMLLIVPPCVLLGCWLFWTFGAIAGGVLGAVAAWFTPRKDWASGLARSGGGSSGSRSGSSSSRSSSSSSGSGSSGGSSSSGGSRSFGGGRSGGGGAGRGF